MKEGGSGLWSGLLGGWVIGGGGGKGDCGMRRWDGRWDGR